MYMGEFVSIIMAAYNAQDTICPAIDSVLAQTYPHFELLVVDDSSTDDTGKLAADYAARDERIRVITAPVNGGAAQARRRGLREARGAWIAILDSDDSWMPDKLEKQLALQRETGARLLFTGSAFMDSAGNRMPWQLHVPERIDYRQLLKQNLISNSSALVEKSLYQTHYADADNVHEDFATWLRILHGGVVAYGLDEPLLVYRLSPTSKSGKKWRSALMNWRTYRYVGLSPLSAFYYMLCYTVNGVKKYRHLT